MIKINQEQYPNQNNNEPIQKPLENGTKFCRNCGTKLNAQAAFCFNCGTKSNPVVSDDPAKVVVEQKPTVTLQEPVSVTLQNQQQQQQQPPFVPLQNQQQNNVQGAAQNFEPQQANFAQPSYNNISNQVPIKKKKNGCLIAFLISLGVVAILIISLIVLVAKNGGNIHFSTANISESYMASQIDSKTFEPTVKQSEFSKNISAIYATAKIKNVPSDTTVYSIWTYIPTGETIRCDHDLNVSNDCWVKFDLTGTPYPTGDYKVDIYLNDKLEKTMDFTVK